MGPIKEQLTVDEVAGMLKADRRVVYDLIKAGKIKAGKVGRGWRIEADSVASFLNNVQDAQKEDKPMGVDDFFSNLKREQEAAFTTKEMEAEYVADQAKKIIPAANSILNSYTAKAREFGIDIYNKYQDCVECYISCKRTRREFCIKSDANVLSFRYMRMKDERPAQYRVPEGVDLFKQEAEKKLTKSISFENWTDTALHEAVQAGIKALVK